MYFSNKWSYGFVGYAVLPGFASAAECTAMIKRMDELVKDFDPTTISVFSTTKQVRILVATL